MADHKARYPELLRNIFEIFFRQAISREPFSDSRGWRKELRREGPITLLMFRLSVRNERRLTKRKEIR